jgi:hypothetical protein
MMVSRKGKSAFRDYSTNREAFEKVFRDSIPSLSLWPLEAGESSGISRADQYTGIAAILTLLN